MASFLAVPLKKTYDVDFVKPLRRFIQETYSQADPDEYNQALNDFNKLRNSMITKSVDKHESALEVLNRYYDQLVAIEGKFPITENQIRVQFKWRDGFDEGSFLAGKRTLAIASAMYEKVCMLFNIAALQSQIAAVQNHDSDEGLKCAAKYFQQSCGIFGHLKDIVMSHIQQDPTPDLSPDTLNALSALMLAQAQESIYKKCASDRMKESMVAKVAFQCSELYADAMKLMQLHSIKELWPKDWLPCVAMKQAAYHALAEFNQSVVSQQTKSYGEEISRLQHALELMNAAQSRGGVNFNFKNELAKIQRALQNAKKDNDFIYHDKVPDIKTLPVIGRATIAKPTPVPSTFSSNFTDLFEKLVPLAVHDALTSFENRKSQIVNMEIGRLREATQLMNSVMASLNLPASIEDLSGQKVPQSVLDKATQLQELQGITYLEKLMQDLPQLLARNQEILDESMKMLDDEEKSDRQLRDQFKERWTRTGSETLTKPMREEGMKYGSILQNATHADKVVQEKYNKHRNAIALLSKPLKELESSLPQASAEGGLQNSQVVKELRSLCDEVETIKAERDAIEASIKDATFDMAPKFFAVMAGDGLIPEEAVSMSELDRVYSPLREQVSESIHRQESILARMQNANTEFCNAKSSNQSAAQRDTVLKDLAAGFDMFMELKGNLEEGTKFYNDLTPLLVRLQGKISDFCFARKTEKDELMADLQKSIVNTPSQAPPVTPRYQGGPPPSAASAPPVSSTGPSLPYPMQPGGPVQQYPGYGTPPQGVPPAGSGASWSAPYPQPAYQGQMPMPASYNPYNPYMSYGQPPPQYPGQQPGYAGQQAPYPYPNPNQPQGYPNQQYPQQQWR
ncbi:programmed cell death 6-interacting protein-like isoform X2 [Gigantopelta aegis]|uniref:programmed cell death 6-interacting protein-like isoform X2 n=1 Tax=Gigantopelta aegis TaxID=1735272 RepID=UPI001B888F43|nr:programmed cell death 6-interacting protein-like isoform X2 [Gigantopelta aegis]